jgi:uncharacterized repeat protein (TIGR01451 family)
MAGWQNQNNCLSDMVVTKTLSKSNPQPGETFTLTINYQNNGTQKAPNFEINEALDEHIEFISSVPINGVPATINKTFGVH